VRFGALSLPQDEAGINFSMKNKTIIIIALSPFILIGWPLGFIWEAFSIGFGGGRRAILSLCNRMAWDK